MQFVVHPHHMLNVKMKELEPYIITWMNSTNILCERNKVQMNTCKGTLYLSESLWSPQLIVDVASSILQELIVKISGVFKPLVS